MTYTTSPPPMSPAGRQPSMLRHDSTHASTSTSPRGFDVIAAYRKALTDDKNPHAVAAILALVELMEASTVTALASELTHGRQLLVDTQTSLGVRAGCQLWERFFALSGGGEDFPAYKRSLIAQGRAFCRTTAPNCRDKIAELAVGFLRDDCVILTHGYSRTVVQAILKAHEQHKRIKVYVTEARPTGLGLRTHQILTAAGVPCTVVLDSAVAYIMDRVDLVLVGSEVVVESGGLVSLVGTYQVALIAKAMQKPFYALAESYKFLRHYPLSQTDLPRPSLSSTSSNTKASTSQVPLAFPASIPPPIFSRQPSQAPATPIKSLDTSPAGTNASLPDTSTNTPSQNWPKSNGVRFEMSREMEDLNPIVDVTTPDLIDFIITDLGAPLSPTSVSQYLVAQFSS